jgi:hypothetical protein
VSQHYVKRRNLKALHFADSHASLHIVLQLTFLYENLLCHVEGQIECWNRKAVREPSPEAVHSLWLKAEGLGYALRLLYAFGPEFRDLIDSANNSNAGGRT